MPKVFPEDEMLYSLRGASNQQLIHVLRCLMRFSTLHTERMVIERMWEFGWLDAGTYGDNNPTSEKFILFPENAEQATPFRLTGERLVERAAFIADTEETIVYRVSIEDDSKFDLAILTDTGSLRVWTDDLIVFRLLSEQFDILNRQYRGFNFHPW